MEKVQAALKHVASIHPEVTQVVYDEDIRWSYQDAQGNPADFTGSQPDIGILEDAADEISNNGRIGEVFTLQ